MKLSKRVLGHTLFTFTFVTLVYYVIKSDIKFLNGELWGITTKSWLFLALIVPIMHQFYVFVCWYLQLNYKSITKSFGNEFGFKLYKIGFAILILLRPVTILILAFSNAHTFVLNSTFKYFISAILFIPSAYLFYSVKKYFGMNKAFGIDHFEPEKFRNETFVKKGIFKYTSNGMYIYGFMALYIPGLLLLSKAAIFAALLNHLYIWVHYYFTELPDIKKIYKN